MNKKIPYLLISLLALSALASCGETEKPKDDQPVDPLTYFKVGDDYKVYEGVSEDYTNAFFDGFNTINKDKWYIGKGGWGTGNGGVLPENVNITDDGILVLSGNGMHYAKNDMVGYGALKDGRNTGSCLVSRFDTKPGHYEIKMKVLPRQGACSAFWTYANKPNPESADNFNHEIDVELPGGSKSGKITFKKALNTNWLTEKDYNTTEYDISETSSDVAYNDGKWHTFGFDWYTNPEVVVYFADGKITSVCDFDVPNLMQKLWLGVWFPTGFVGSSDFESDNMYVDEVSYVPFKNQECIEYSPSVDVIDKATDADYKKTPIIIQEANKVSNGNFEYAKTTETDSSGDKIISGKGWSFLRTASEMQEIKDVSYISETEGKGGTCGAVIKDGGVLRQAIDSVYDGYRFNYSFDAKGSKNTGNTLYIDFMGSSSSEKLSSNSIAIDSTDFKNYTGELTAPKGTESIRIEARSEKGNVLYLDNVKLEKVQSWN